MAKPKNTVHIEFPSQELFDEFVGWFLDGGGEYQFGEALEARTGKSAHPQDWRRAAEGGVEMFYATYVKSKKRG